MGSILHAATRRSGVIVLDLADAFLVDLADRIDTGQILTLDRDLEICRRSRRKFELLIDL